MEKRKNNKKNVDRNQKNKDSHKHHHTRLSIDKMNTKFLNFMQKVQTSKNETIMKNTKLNNVNNSNISNVKEAEKKDVIKDKKEKLKRNGSNMLISGIEKNYIKDKLENFKQSKEEKQNNIKHKVVDYNNIINNNKTDVYYKGDNKNNELLFTKEKKQIKNLKPSMIKDFIENSRRIIYSQTNKKPKENIEMNKTNIENNNLFQKQIDLSNNKNNIQKKLGDTSENVIKKNNHEIKGDNFIKQYEKKVAQNEELKNNEIKNNIEKEEIIKKEKINIKNEYIGSKREKVDESQIKEKDLNNSSKKNTKPKKNGDRQLEQIYFDYQKKLMKKELKPTNSIDKKNFKTEIKSYLSKYANINDLLETFPGGFNCLKNKLMYLNVSFSEEEFNFICSQKNFYKSPNVKELFRKGIPLKYIKTFITKLLNLDNCTENYNLKYAMILKELDTNYIGEYVPYYYGKTKKKLKEILPIHYLNEEGIKQLKITMWLISDLVPKIEYSPFLIKICSILLIFFEKEEAFEAMRTLIEMNYDPSDLYKLRWHFRYSFNENEKLVDSIKKFVEKESEKINELFELFKRKGLEPLLLVKDFVENLFLDFLNFYGIIRFICIFLFEGVKSLYRISFAILNYIYDNYLEEIKNSKKDLKSKLENLIFNTFDYNKIFEEAFNIQISRFNNGYIKNDDGEDIKELQIPFECATKYHQENSEEDSNKEEKIIKEKEKEQENLKKRKHNYISNYYLPSIEPKSNILTSKYLFKLWPKLPKKFRNYDLATIYSLSRKKVNMKSIIELSHKYPQNFKILILIETEQEELFGFILPQMLNDTGEDNYIKLEKCYLINFLPKINVYKDENEKICEKMLCCNKKGLWFCKEQVGDLLFIEGTLTEGFICKDNTYFGKINLTKKGNFLIKDFEIIVFVENNI